MFYIDSENVYSSSPPANSLNERLSPRYQTWPPFENIFIVEKNCLIKLAFLRLSSPL